MIDSFVLLIKAASLFTAGLLVFVMPLATSLFLIAGDFSLKIVLLYSLVSFAVSKMILSLYWDIKEVSKEEASADTFTL